MNFDCRDAWAFAAATGRSSEATIERLKYQKLAAYIDDVPRSQWSRSGAVYAGGNRCRRRPTSSVGVSIETIIVLCRSMGDVIMDCWSTNCSDKTQHMVADCWNEMTGNIGLQRLQGQHLTNKECSRTIVISKRGYGRGSPSSGSATTMYGNTWSSNWSRWAYEITKHFFYVIVDGALIDESTIYLMMILIDTKTLRSMGSRLRFMIIDRMFKLETQ